MDQTILVLAQRLTEAVQFDAMGPFLSEHHRTHWLLPTVPPDLRVDRDRVNRAARIGEIGWLKLKRSDDI